MLTADFTRGKIKKCCDPLNYCYNDENNACSSVLKLAVM